MNTETGLKFFKNYEDDIVETKRTCAPDFLLLNTKLKEIYIKWWE